MRIHGIKKFLVLKTMNNFYSEVSHSFPLNNLISNIASNAYRHRHKTMPPLPESVMDLHLEGHTGLEDGSQFLIVDYVSESNQRVLIFAKMDHLKKLANCNHVFMDGTFYSSPQMFDSLYTIHGELTQGLIVPLVYVLATNRTSETYKLCFRKLCAYVLEKVGVSFSPCNFEIIF